MLLGNRYIQFRIGKKAVDTRSSVCVFELRNLLDKSVHIGLIVDKDDATASWFHTKRNATQVGERGGDTSVFLWRRIEK